MYLPSSGTIFCGYFVPADKEESTAQAQATVCPSSGKAELIIYQQKNLGRILVFYNVLI